MRTKVLRCFLALSLAAPIAGCKKEEPAPAPAPAVAAAPAVEDTSAMDKAAERLVDSEFKPSTLSREQQLAELKWFRDAAKPYRGQTVNVVSETLDVHVYESKT